MLDPGIKMHIYSGHRCSCESFSGTTAVTCFNIVILEQPFMATFYGGTTLEHILESIGVTWNRRKKPWVLIRFDIDGPAVWAVGTIARFFNTVTDKPAPVFNAFRIGIVAVFIRYATLAERISMVIKTKNTWRKNLIRVLNVGIQRNKGCHGKMLQ